MARKAKHEAQFEQNDLQLLSITVSMLIVNLWNSIRTNNSINQNQKQKL